MATLPDIITLSHSIRDIARQPHPAYAPTRTVFDCQVDTLEVYMRRTLSPTGELSLRQRLALRLLRGREE